VPRGVAAPPAAPAPPKRKLSFKEQRELDSLPGEIEKLEGEQQALTLRVCEPDYHKVGADQMRVDRERASELVKLIAARMERWEALEALASLRGV
jgi:ATP-binding cassette subfamily F protein uup